MVVANIQIRYVIVLRCHLRFMVTGPVTLQDDMETVAGGAIGLRRHHYRLHCHRCVIHRGGTGGSGQKHT